MKILKLRIHILKNSFLKFQIRLDYMHFQFDHCVNFASVLIKYATKVHWSYVKFRYDLIKQVEVQQYDTD